MQYIPSKFNSIHLQFETQMIALVTLIDWWNLALTVKDNITAASDTETNTSLNTHMKDRQQCWQHYSWQTPKLWRITTRNITNSLEQSPFSNCLAFFLIQVYGISQSSRSKNAFKLLCNIEKEEGLKLWGRRRRMNGKWGGALCALSATLTWKVSTIVFKCCMGWEERGKQSNA